MIQAIVLDIPPEPAGIGAFLAVVFLVIGFLLLLTAGLVVYLWYRKRGMRGIEMIRPDKLPAIGWPRGSSPTVRESVSASPAQPNSPNQP
jgi:hypothetical protein